MNTAGGQATVANNSVSTGKTKDTVSFRTQKILFPFLSSQKQTPQCSKSELMAKTEPQEEE